MKVKSNQERAVDNLIHDTNGSIGTIVNYVKGIKIRLEKDPSDPKILEGLEGIDAARKRIMGVIDRYYARFKGDFSDDVMTK